jgi:hypothetical protein
VAVNFLCFTAGPDLARHPAFRPIKVAILQDEDHILEFVDLIERDHTSSEERDALAMFCRPDHHSLLLGDPGGEPSAMIALYGEPVARVQFATEKIEGVQVETFLGLGVPSFALRVPFSRGTTSPQAHLVATRALTSFVRSSKNLARRGCASNSQ